MEIPPLDIPFNFRYTCWFCGEGSHQEIAVLLTRYQKEKVYVPICDECKSYQCHQEVKSLMPLKERIKAKIVARSAKELSIGANWTEQELQESGLNGSAFDGFKRSGWKMYLIAKERINFPGWDVTVNGIPVDNLLSNDEVFAFNGLTFSSFDSMLNSLSKSFSLNKNFLSKVITVYGNNKTAEAVNFCRLVPHHSEVEREKAYNDLVSSLKEKEQLAQQKAIKLNISIDTIMPVTIRNNSIPTTLIHWAMKNGVINFDVLDALESHFFETFSSEGDENALQLFNALESYIDKRLSSTTWKNEQDPNAKLWAYIESKCS